MQGGDSLGRESALNNKDLEIIKENNTPHTVCTGMILRYNKQPLHN